MKNNIFLQKIIDFCIFLIFKSRLVFGLGFFILRVQCINFFVLIYSGLNIFFVYFFLFLCMCVNEKRNNIIVYVFCLSEKFINMIILYKNSPSITSPTSKTTAPKTPCPTTPPAPKTSPSSTTPQVPLATPKVSCSLMKTLSLMLPPLITCYQDLSDQRILGSVTFLYPTFLKGQCKFA